METLVGMLLATSPIAVTAALLALAGRRERRERAAVARQIALTDALHARVGAALAPVVRRRRQHWEIRVAVPAEQPAIVPMLMITVEELFGRAAYEVALRPQAPLPAPAPARRAAPAAQESLSWT